MTDTTITVREYEAAEKDLEAAGSRRGIAIHAAITVAVSVALVVINVVVASQFPWSPFPVVGMGIGLLVHYLFGVRWLERSVEGHQREIERHAIDLRTAGRTPA
ncbi:MAG TPA: 2TM domain-containing protein [Candidatus Dormibacteraeota bacterium]|nr:2TM domain-containing protein [Candidatus Dormibacteraeota bacterium]